MRRNLSKREKGYLAKARIARISSVGPRGRPYVAPFCHAFDPDLRSLYVTTSESGTTARNVRARSAVAVVCDEYLEDWDRLRGVVVTARARRVGEPERRKAASLLKRKFRQYGDDDFDFVLAFDVTAVTSWGL